MEIQLQRVYMDLAQRPGKIDFSLSGGEYDPLVEEMTQFQYPIRTIEHNYNEWMEVHHNMVK